jgi:hypothetical protein
MVHTHAHTEGEVEGKSKKARRRTYRLGPITDNTPFRKWAESRMASSTKDGNEPPTACRFSVVTYVSCMRSAYLNNIINPTQGMVAAPLILFLQT